MAGRNGRARLLPSGTPQSAGDPNVAPPERRPPDCRRNKELLLPLPRLCGDRPAFKWLRGLVLWLAGGVVGLSLRLARKRLMQGSLSLVEE